MVVITSLRDYDIYLPNPSRLGIFSKYLQIDYLIAFFLLIYKLEISNHIRIYFLIEIIGESSEESRIY